MAILRLYSTDFSRREREHETELYQVLLLLDGNTHAAVTKLNTQ
ncbi:hypothetical protein CRENPOLYSF1_900022 [Crenothrix polyspora]|uniref:Uncharacterized protein n=1 Tax=Crenothrix polyspora TaxID=360316 RepID=A0A1R4HJX1_9GAMM|nr:hypothetical protein CRENPOLYSF1_900022 [Crenothrix polyspora]